ncbi:FkbM family methyltransferase [Paenibacillus silagei]|uniref:FkbM family methyltransferase n=1 Tax=Paenibacillus silagei TaxID=1670801 RepID=A0ABS4NU75_9BACL|nr:FkbM family methyltransferase [Paenibacillus silagei]MBP2112944.1 FkbM family methyltransferase [Paenibacillus silagei]
MPEETRYGQIQRMFWEKRVDAVQLLRRALKEQVEQIEIHQEETRIRLTDGRRFVWDTGHLNSLGFLMRDGFVEREESRLLSVLIREGFEVLDIGANYGWYSTLFAQAVGQSGRVHSFEPVSPTFAELSRNIQLNNLQNVILNQVALSDYNGEAEIYLPVRSGSEDAALIIDPALQHETYHCRVQTLDTYIEQQQISHIDLVKIDIEGGELKALKGMEQYLQRHHEKPLLMLEATEVLALRFGNSISDVFRFLKQYQYQLFQLSAEELVELDSAAEVQAQNIFGLQPEHIRRYSPFIRLITIAK